MTDIFVTVNDYGEVYLSSDVLGIKGEGNARRLVFMDTPLYSGASYEVWFDVGAQTPYSSLITNGKCIVPSSVLAADTVDVQWVAIKEMQIMAKSQIFTMRVLESLDDENMPIPTYEDAQTVLQDITSIIDTDGAKNSVFVKKNSSQRKGEWKSLSDIAKQVSFAQTFILNWYSSPTEEQTEQNLSAIKSYSSASFPKSLVLKAETGNVKKYLTASTVSITGSTYDIMFACGDSVAGAGVNCKRIVANISSDSYSQYDYTNRNFMLDDDKAKLASITSGAEANVIETIKVNGTALSIVDKAVNISVPSAANLISEGQVRTIVSEMIDEITDADEVNY